MASDDMMTSGAASGVTSGDRDGFWWIWLLVDMASGGYGF